MPAYSRPATQWFYDQVTGIKREIAALRATRTQYVTDKGVCQVIIGDISHDHEGTATGLTGWGIASFKTKAWVQL